MDTSLDTSGRKKIIESQIASALNYYAQFIAGEPLPDLHYAYLKILENDIPAFQENLSSPSSIGRLSDICLERLSIILLDKDPKLFDEYLKINRAIEKEYETLYPRRFPKVFINAKNSDLRMIKGTRGESRREIFENESREILATLSDRDQLIIKLRFGFEGQGKLSYSKIGQIVGMTKLGVIKAERRILNKSGLVVKKDLTPSEK